MKKFLAIALALGVVLSLAACGPKDPGDVPDKGKDVQPSVTAEDLLSTNYGVDELKSITMSVFFDINVADYVGVLGGVYEETEDLIHLAVDAVDVANVDTWYDIYYDRVSQKLYTQDENGLWVGERVPDFDLGLRRVCDLNATDLIFDTELAVGSESKVTVDEDGNETVEGVYEVHGRSDSGVVADIVSFILENNDLVNYACNSVFTYDAGTQQLVGMSWTLHGEEYEVIIEADVDKVNETEITLPFDPAETVKDNVPEEVEDDWDWKLGRLENETLLATEYFNVEYADNETFMKGIGERYSGMHEGVLYTARYWFNSYSREGFMRMLATGKPQIEEDYDAAVLVCGLAGVDKECLWKDGYMTEEQAMLAWDMFFDE